MFPLPTRNQVSLRAKSFGLSTVLWLFGIFTTVLLVGLWGRSVAGDQVTLEASTRAVLESELVNDRVTDWLGDAVAAASELGPEKVAAVVESVEGSPVMEAAIENVVDQAVEAALAPPGTVTSIDLSQAIESLAPVVAVALEEQGVISDADVVRAAAHGVPGIVLSADDELTVGGAARQARSFLTKVVVVGLTGMLVFGGAAVAMNPDRIRQLRALVIRLGVSAFTFAIVIRVGAWAVDPAGGRSPVAAGGAVLLGSNGHIMAIVTGAAAAVAAAMSMFLRRRRRPADLAIDDKDDVTGEQRVLVGAVI